MCLRKIPTALALFFAISTAIADDIILKDSDGNEAAVFNCHKSRPVCKVKGPALEAEFSRNLASVYRANFPTNYRAGEKFGYFKVFQVPGGALCAIILLDFLHESYYVNLDTMAHGFEQWVCSG